MLGTSKSIYYETAHEGFFLGTFQDFIFRTYFEKSFKPNLRILVYGWVWEFCAINY